jgi:hypothetical protein
MQPARWFWPVEALCQRVKCAAKGNDGVGGLTRGPTMLSSSKFAPKTTVLQVR